MADRYTNIPSEQIKDDDLKVDDLDVTTPPTDGQILRVNMPTGDFTPIDPGSGSGDMSKSEYDVDDDGIVDKAEELNDGSSGGGNAVTAEEIRTFIDSSNLNGINIYFVGKHGNNSKNGKTWDNAKLTIQDAIDDASSGDAIICLDSGIYNEDITCKDGVDIFAPNAILDLESGGNNLVLADQKTVFKKIVRSGGSGFSIGNTGTGITSILIAEEIQDASSDFIVRNLAISSELIVYIKKLSIDGASAIGISDAGSGTSKIHVNIDDIYLNANNTIAIQLVTSINIFGYIHNIVEVGSRTGTIAIDLDSGTISLNVNTINTDIAYDVESGAVLNLFCNSLLGTELNDGISNISLAGETRTHIDDLNNPHEVTADQVGLGNIQNLINKNSLNIALNGFRDLVNNSLAIQTVVDGIIDEYETEDGVNTNDSSNENYDDINSLYHPNTSIISNANIEDEDMADITDWTDNDTGTGVSSQESFDTRTTMKLDSGNAGASRNKNIGAVGTRTVISLTIYCDTLGTLAQGDITELIIKDGTTGIEIAFASDGLFVWSTGSAFFEIGTNLVVQDVWQEWAFDIDWSGLTMDIYLNGDLKESDIPFINASAGANGDTILRTKSVTNPNILAYIDFFKAGDDFTSSANMSLISNIFTAENQPDIVRIILFEEDIDSITINTDLKSYVSRDAGQVFTTDFSTDNKLDISSHGFSNGDRLLLISSNTLPEGLDSETIYYVISADTNDFEVSLTMGGDAIDIINDGTGTHTAIQVTEVVLEEVGLYDSGKQILTDEIDISNQPSGTSMRYITQTKNEKSLNLHGTALLWD